MCHCKLTFPERGKILHFLPIVKSEAFKIIWPIFSWTHETGKFWNWHKQERKSNFYFGHRQPWNIFSQTNLFFKFLIFKNLNFWILIEAQEVTLTLRENFNATLLKNAERFLVLNISQGRWCSLALWCNPERSVSKLWKRFSASSFSLQRSLKLSSARDPPSSVSDFELKKVKPSNSFSHSW